MLTVLRGEIVIKIIQISTWSIDFDGLNNNNIVYLVKIIFNQLISNITMNAWIASFNHGNGDNNNSSLHDILT